MKELLLLKNGEIALKGLNRGAFEDILIKNIKRRLRPLGNFEYSKFQSTIYIKSADEAVDFDEAADCLKKVFGLAGICRATECEKDLQVIMETAATYLNEQLSAVSTFKVEAKRSDKQFPFTSPEICRELGAYLLEKFPHLRVDVHRPQIAVTVEVRDVGAYIHTGNQQGAGGMPVGSSGKAVWMISGGIDSPVAGYMMARRGLELVGVHFESPPYTSERAKRKVIDLCKKVSEYSGRIKLYVVPFTAFQEQIRDRCAEEYFTIIMRRYMCRIAERLGEMSGCQAIITGESLAQVASQTLSAIACTDEASGMPILRPVIGMDKADIVAAARNIETFDISIQPYEDCCTVFTPKHPKTKPKLVDVLREEAKLEDANALLERAIEKVEVIWVEF